MNYNEKYQKWVSKEDLDPTLKAELLSMDETAKEDAFYTDVDSRDERYLRCRYK